MPPLPKGEYEMSEQMTFEKAILRLEEIASALEAGKLALDKAVELYKEGMELSLYCTKEIEKAKLTMEEFGKKVSSEE